MANFGKIQVPSNLSNLKTLPDVIRYFSAFASQITDSFNGLASQKSVWGVIGFTGVIVSGSSAIGFAASFVGTGLYYMTFREPFNRMPAVVVSPWSIGVASNPVARIDGITTTGFAVSIFSASNSGTAENGQFSFIAMGAG